MNTTRKEILDAVILLALAIFLGFVLGLNAGCTPKRVSPTVHWNESPAQIAQDAAVQAAGIGGVVYLVAPTGSMEPALMGGDYVVVDPKFPYNQLSVGRMTNYQARWLPPEDPTVTHWASAKQGNEWIMDGEHNAHYENTQSYLMGPIEFKGVVTDIYTTRNQ